ncbi:hypothetical protein G7072_09365 [Nocardioides sp. HDW12B]|uniref:hypothetical protein n=1 Tax=Nocardioides sp. HDW12B TaxID=2714939 RepID=UPI00140DE629|nr:hypothetical protein [Nocardioides sp. HDW12B]QIK66532.1 hypothetical protein G7072_09365 [Nocardioides sp. HDW12B]
MKRTTQHAVSALATGLAATSLALVGAAPAHADGRTCVSEAEYQDIRWAPRPPTMGKVRDHFDTKGVVVWRWSNGPDTEVTRSYVKCPEWNGGRGRVQVFFNDYSWDGLMRVDGMAPAPRGDWVFPWS